MGVPYEHQEFPKMVYHRSYHTTDRTQVVADQDALDALDANEWRGSPVDCDPPKKKAVPAGRRAAGVDAADEDEPAGDAEVDDASSSATADTVNAKGKKAKK